MNFNPYGFVEQLPNLGMGMLGIFVVIGAIILSTRALNGIFKDKKD